MNRTLAALMAGLAIAGCSKSDTVDEKDASVEQVSKAIADAGASARFTPGRWETRVDLKNVEGQGLPPGALESARAAISRAGVVATCLTPEQAAKPGAGFFNQDTRNCTYKRFKMADGKLDALLTCGANGEESAEMVGTFDPTHYQIALTNKTGIGGRSMTMTMNVDSRHAGQCRGDEKGA
ncbi:MAG TPA: DUF3617 domain-containing protein [Sphingomicrobium sp.]|jgi:hypothetical protein|nr:DUF3617 domain-containing protein [Sphingomicrobium sp.]